jgi:predicted enzyme related to lactoylglutathione lyase
MKLLCALALAPLLALATGPADDDGAPQARRAALGYDGSVIAVLDVADLEAAVAWYGEHLGLEPILNLTDYGWAELTTPVKGAAIGLSVPQDAPKRPGAVVLGVKDVAAAVAKLKSGGVAFEGEVVDLPGLVKLAKFHDPDGNAITLAESQGE